MTTIKDIGRHVGLSVTQVSRALNGHSDVNPETMKRVKDAAEELGYSANLTARMLVTGKSGLVTLIRAGRLTGPADAANLETISGLSEEFFRCGKQFTLNMLPPNEDPEPVYRQSASNGTFGGFVLIDTQFEDPRIPLLDGFDIPYVVHGRASETAEHAFYDIDNFAVLKQHIEHLADLGHKRIGFLNGVSGYAYAEYRLRSYRRTLEELGLPYHGGFVSHGPMTEQRGMVATVQLMTGGPERPTAIICGNVQLAKGAYSALSAMNLSIPEDVSVTAHDDVYVNVRPSSFFPALTVTQAAFRKSWVHLAGILCDMIDGKDGERQVIASSDFILRASTTAAPKVT